MDLGYGGDLVGSAALMGEFIGGVPHPNLRETTLWDRKHLPVEVGRCSLAEWGAVPLVQAGHVAGQALCGHSVFLHPLRAAHPFVIRVPCLGQI